jgi:hypothetical protein
MLDAFKTQPRWVRDHARELVGPTGLPAAGGLPVQSDEEEAMRVRRVRRMYDDV